MTYPSEVTDIRLEEDVRALSRLERRKALTKAALIDAAQRLMAEGRTNVPIQEITEAADLGTGSFYNHFNSKDDLFSAAREAALESLASVLDRLGDSLDDPAAVFAQGFRLTGRMHRLEPQLSKVVISYGFEGVNAQAGMARYARRDIEAAVGAGRFKVTDIDAAMVVVIGSTLALGHTLHDRPDLDDAELTDRVAGDLLVMLGLTRREATRICSRPLPDVQAP